jgi:hypothetical protein
LDFDGGMPYLLPYYTPSMLERQRLSHAQGRHEGSTFPQCKLDKSVFQGVVDLFVHRGAQVEEIVQRILEQLPEGTPRPIM